MQNLLGETASYIIVVELVDIIIFLIIFFGLYKKWNEIYLYETQQNKGIKEVRIGDI